VVCLVATPARSETPVITYPLPATTKNGNVSTTITTTNAWQQLWPAAPNTSAPSAGIAGARHGCSIQNNGTHNMLVSEGYTVATAATGSSWVLAPGLVYNCNFQGIVLFGEIDITGTGGEAFYAAQF